LPSLNLALVLLVGGWQVSRGDLTLGTLVAFMSYLFMLVWPLDALAWILAMGEEATTASQRLAEVLDARPEIADGPRARVLSRPRGAVRFERVGFRYSDSGAWVLRGLELDLEPGETTRVGEQGYSLSGGQRQRLALARAVLGSPRVLVLDDPLSAVDVHTEHEIETALASALQGVTALLVAHRPSTLALADRVALLEGGRVLAVGTHSELLRSHPRYRSLLAEGVEVA